MKKIYGTFGVEMRAYGQKLVQFCKHTCTQTHTHTHAAKLVVEIKNAVITETACVIVEKLSTFHPFCFRVLVFQEFNFMVHTNTFCSLKTYFQCQSLAFLKTIILMLGAIQVNIT